VTDSPADPTEKHRSDEGQPAEQVTEPSSGRRPWVQRVVMIGVALAIFGIAKATGLWEAVSLESIQGWVAAAGWLAAPVYLLLFTLGVSIALPGMLFIVSGLLAFGPYFGPPLALLGATSAGTFAVWWYGKVGGKPVGPPAHPIARRLQGKLGQRPIMAVAAVRFITRLAPPANMMLALAGVKPHHNAIGTLLGFIPKVLIAAFFLDHLVAWLSS